MTFRIIFEGETLPGVTRETAQRNLVEQMSMPPAQAEAMLSGKRFVLKRGLDAMELSRYLERLVKAGLHVRAEPETEAAAPAPAPATTPTPPAVPVTPVQQAPASPPPLSLAATVAVAPPPPEAEEIVCPRCQERQPKRTLCRSCGTDIPRFVAAQEAIEAERRAEAAAAREAARGSRGQRQVAYGSDDDQPSLLGFSFSGRMRRRTYILAGALQMLLGMALLNIVLAAGGLMGSAILLALAIIPWMIWGFRIAALRCHDLGWSGWLVLLMLLPIANVVMPLLLLFMPGQADDNEYGPQPAPTPWLYVFGSVALCVVGVAITSVMLEKSVPELATLSRAGGRAPASSNYSAARNEVVMYSLTTCGYCAEKRQQLTAEGIPFTEVFLDQDQNAQAEFSRKLQFSGHNGGVGTPSFEINGELLLNNPSMSAIRSKLRS